MDMDIIVFLFKLSLPFYALLHVVYNSTKGQGAQGVFDIFCGWLICCFSFHMKFGKRYA